VRTPLAVVVGLALTSGAFVAAANGQSGAGPPLGLADAIRIAERRSPAYRQALNDGEVSAAREREVVGAYLPQLAGGVVFGGSTSRRLTALDEFGNSVRLPDPINFRSSSTTQRIGADLTLYDGGARERLRVATRFESRAAVARATAARSRLSAEVARRYYQAVGADRRVRVEERLLTSAREQLAATGRLFRVAARTREDVLGTHVDVVTREAALERARGDVSKAMAFLREALGVGGGDAFLLTDSLPGATGSERLDPDSLIARTLRVSPLLAELEASAAALERRVSVARGGRWPTISASAMFSRFGSDRDYQALFDLDPPDQFFTFGLTTSVPFFNRFRVKGAVVQASAAAEDARQDVAAARLAIAREVRNALTDWENAGRQVQLTEQAVALSRERVELAAERYRAGALGFPEFQLVSDRAASAEREAVDARVALANARVTLEERLGGVGLP